MTPHVVIAGGGVGALEGLLALQDLARDRVRISVLTAARHMTYRPLSVAEPFGASPRGATTGSRSPGIAGCAGSRTSRRRPSRSAGARHPATVRRSPTTGCCWRSAPGRSRRWRAPSRSPARATPGDQGDDRGAGSRASHTIAFVAMTDTAWTLPLYELALMTADYGRRREPRPGDRAGQRRVLAARGLRGGRQRGGTARRLTDAGFASYRHLPDRPTRSRDRAPAACDGPPAARPPRTTPAGSCP